MGVHDVPRGRHSTEPRGVRTTQEQLSVRVVRHRAWTTVLHESRPPLGAVAKAIMGRQAGETKVVTSGRPASWRVDRSGVAARQIAGRHLNRDFQVTIDRRGSPVRPPGAKLLRFSKRLFRLVAPRRLVMGTIDRSREPVSRNVADAAAA